LGFGASKRPEEIQSEGPRRAKAPPVASPEGSKSDEGPIIDADLVDEVGRVLTHSQLARKSVK
jgi:hypothetical protein